MEDILREFPEELFQFLLGRLETAKRMFALAGGNSFQFLLGRLET